MACFRCGNEKLTFIRSTHKISNKKKALYPSISNYRWFCSECGSHERRGGRTMNNHDIEMHMLKHEAHTLVDHYWLYDGYTRLQVYTRIRKVLKLKQHEKHHIRFLSKQQLEKLIKIVKEGNFLWYQRAL